MTNEQKINRLLESNNGYLTRKEIDDLGIPSIALTRFSKKHGLRRIARGFYALEDWIVDPYLVFQYTYPRYVYSFSSAIYLHGLGDIIPNYLEVTGPINYRPFPQKRSDIITHTDTVGRSYSLGLVRLKTSLGNMVSVYDKEKTICDLIKHNDIVEFETYAKALLMYSRSKDRNINKLMNYARALGIERKVREQMEVMLNGD